MLAKKASTPGVHNTALDYYLNNPDCRKNVDDMIDQFDEASSGKHPRAKGAKASFVEWVRGVYQEVHNRPCTNLKDWDGCWADFRQSVKESGFFKKSTGQPTSTCSENKINMIRYGDESPKLGYSQLSIEAARELARRKELPSWYLSKCDSKTLNELLEEVG